MKVGLGATDGYDPAGSPFHAQSQRDSLVSEWHDELKYRRRSQSVADRWVLASGPLSDNKPSPLRVNNVPEFSELQHGVPISRGVRYADPFIKLPG